MSVGYSTNRQFADSWSEALSNIILKHVDKIVSIKPAGATIDKTQATDFTVSTKNGNTIAARIRRDVAKRFRDFTIRAKCAGEVTELDKLQRGFVDYYLYAWTDRGTIDDWILVNVQRAVDAGVFAKERHLTVNKDGTTGFVAVPLSELRDASAVIAECYPPPKALWCAHGRCEFLDGRCVRCKRCAKCPEDSWVMGHGSHGPAKVCGICGKFIGYVRAS